MQTAEDGFDALRAIRAELPDIVISDLNMPRMSGFEFLSILRRRFPQIRVVAMSGAYTGKLIPQAIAADAFYEKASNAGALFQMVAAVGKAEREAIAQTPELAPMWVPSNGHNLSGLPYVSIACPECMRTFAQTLSEGDFLVKEAHCQHCQTPIYFAVVHPTGIPYQYTLATKIAVVATAQMALSAQK